jgi:hypothetical protein
VGAGPKASRTWSSFLWTRGTHIINYLQNITDRILGSPYVFLLQNIFRRYKEWWKI